MITCQLSSCISRVWLVQKAVVMFDQSLNIERVIYSTYGAHPEIVSSFRDLSNVHANHYH